MKMCQFWKGNLNIEFPWSRFISSLISKSLRHILVPIWACWHFVIKLWIINEGMTIFKIWCARYVFRVTFDTPGKFQVVLTCISAKFSGFWIWHQNDTWCHHDVTIVSTFVNWPFLLWIWTAIRLNYHLWKLQVNPTLQSKMPAIPI